MYNGGISRVARGCPVFPDFTSGDSMDTFIQMLRNISPEVYESLKTAVELGKWADGRKLTQEQKELCLQAIIAWEMDNLPEEERTGYIAQSCKNASKAPANLDESLCSAAKGTLHWWRWSAARAVSARCSVPWTSPSGTLSPWATTSCP